MWGYVLLAIALYEASEHLKKGWTYKQDPNNPTVAPDSMLPFAGNSQNSDIKPTGLDLVMVPTMADLGQYAPSLAVPLPSPPNSPSPGAQGGPLFPGQCPCTLPTMVTGGILLNPVTNAPVFTGPNGENAQPWRPGLQLNRGHTYWQMPDGRWAQYVPGDDVIDANRWALGIGSVYAGDDEYSIQH